MQQYNPALAPDPDGWLELDEFERICLVQEFVEENEVEIPEEAQKIHAVIHVVVENQLATVVEPVPATMARLIRQGLSRHEAIHAVGAVLAEDMFALMKGDTATWSRQHYSERLEKLTAKN
ncbi:MAG: hypothetical protein R8K50_02960 [Mariprofundus sp.]